MVEFRRFVPLAFVMASVLVLGACANSETTPTPVTTPTPTPTPTPSPSGPTFTVSGTISETAPTTTTRVPEAEVQVSGGVATGSASDGSFTIPNVASGTYTLRIAKAGYETKTQTVTVSGANVTGVQVTLMPVFQWINREIFAQLGSNGPTCPGTSRACHIYPISSHHSGEVRAFAAWNSTAADFDFEWWCGGVRVERRGQVGNDHDEILPRITGGQTCAIHLLHSGATMSYTLYLTYPS